MPAPSRRADGAAVAVRDGRPVRRGASTARSRLVRSLHRARANRERGSAVAEYAMVGVLLMVLVLGLVQVAVALHVRNTLLQCAVEGARYGARADVDPSTAVPRARELVRGFATAAYARDVSARTTTVDGAQVVEVTIHAPLPVIGTLGPPGALTVSGRAYREGQDPS